MSSVIIAGNTSGSITLSAPAISGSSVLTLPVATDTLVGKATTDTLTNKTLTAPAISSAVMTTMASSVLTSGTAVASTSGTSIDFTGIPSWVKRITVMFNGVSTNGTSAPLLQIGSGSVDITGYTSTGSQVYGTNLCNITTSTAGYIIFSGGATNLLSGTYVFTLVSSNTWVGSSVINNSLNPIFGAGMKSLSGTLDRVRITTVNGTDAFDAGSINIMYE